MLAVKANRLNARFQDVNLDRALSCNSTNSAKQQRTGAGTLVAW